MTDRNIYLQKKNLKKKMNTPGTLYELLIFDNEKLAAKTEGPHLILRRARLGDSVESPYLTDTESKEDEPTKTKGFSFVEINEELEIETAIESLKGELPEGEQLDEQIEEIESIKSALPAGVQLNEEIEETESIRSSLPEGVQHEEIEETESKKSALPEGVQLDEKENKEELVSLETISTYIESLAHHVPAEVERVVDAIVSLEPELEAEITEAPAKNDAEMDGLAEEADSNEHDTPELTENQEKEEKRKEKKPLDLSDIFRSLKKARKKATQKSTSYTKKVEYED